MSVDDIIIDGEMARLKSQLTQAEWFSLEKVLRIALRHVIDAVRHGETFMTKHCDIHNGLDIIDSRDVIARLDELAEQRQNLIDYPDTTSPLEEDELAELVALEKLADEANGSPDWPHGETLIRDSYFETYAQELAEDIGAINKNASWPNNCIDWEEAAELLKQDYSTVDYDGVTYWIRG